MNKYWWEVKVTIHDSANNVVAELEGWQLSDTTLDKIQLDVDALINDADDDYNFRANDEEASDD
jgi:hypothetical protein